MWLRYSAAGVRGRFLKLCADLFAKAHTRVSIDGVLSELIEILVGVQPGSPLSPDFFTTVFNCLLRVIREAGLGVMVFTVLVEGFLFMDDASLPVGSADELRVLLLLTARFSQTVKLPFCGKPKSVVMVIASKEDYSETVWKFPPFELPTVKEHTIVGLTLSQDLSWGADTTSRLEKVKTVKSLLHQAGIFNGLLSCAELCAVIDHLVWSTIETGWAPSSVFSGDRGTVGLTHLVRKAFFGLWKTALRCQKTGVSELGCQAELTALDTESHFSLFVLRLYGQWCLAPPGSGPALLLPVVRNAEAFPFFARCEKLCVQLKVPLKVTRGWSKTVTNRINGWASSKWKTQAAQSPALAFYLRFRKNPLKPTLLHEVRWFKGFDLILRARVGALVLGRWFEVSGTDPKVQCNVCGSPVPALPLFQYPEHTTPHTTNPSLLFHLFLGCEQTEGVRRNWFPSHRGVMPQQ